MDIRQSEFPVHEQVAGACEILGLDPLYVANEGVFVAIVSAEASDEILSILRTRAECAHASVVGVVTEEHKGQVVLTSAIGGKRVVNMLVGEQLPRIC